MIPRQSDVRLSGSLGCRVVGSRVSGFMVQNFKLYEGYTVKELWDLLEGFCNGKFAKAGMSS